ncbi:hypothetical protein V8F06_012861 [Rhypophila decipiens]
MLLFLQINSVFFSIPILLLPSNANAQNNWSNFPYNSRSCLNHYTELSSCDRSNARAWNYCLCNNYESWITNVAACVNKEAPDDLETVYVDIVAVCAGTGTPTLFSLDDFMAAAAAGVDTSTTLSTTTSSTGTAESPPKHTQTDTTGITPTPTNEKEKSDGDGGLTTSDKIAIGLGIPAGFFGVIGSVATWWMCCRRKGSEEAKSSQARPLLE